MIIKKDEPKMKMKMRIGKVEFIIYWCAKKNQRKKKTNHYSISYQ